MNMKQTLDTREYITVLKEMTEQGMDVSMTISGTSMEPFLIHGRDRIYFQKPKSPIQKGDMVFFQRTTGEYVMHRVMKVNDHRYYVAGDHQTFLEGPIEETQIFAKVVSVERDGVWLTEKDHIWNFYAVWWRRLFWIRKVVNKVKRIIWK